MLLKLVTFNLKRTILRWDKRNFLNRVAAIQEFFAQQKPDLVGTQELTIRDLRQAEEALPQYRWIGLGRGGGHRSEFSAIFLPAGPAASAGPGDLLALLPPGAAGQPGADGRSFPGSAPGASLKRWKRGRRSGSTTPIWTM